MVLWWFHCYRKGWSQIDNCISVSSLRLLVFLNFTDFYFLLQHKLQDDEKVYKEAETHFLEKVEEIELEHEDEE